MDSCARFRRAVPTRTHQLRPLPPRHTNTRRYTHWCQRAFATNELLLGYKVDVGLYNALVPDEWEEPDLGADIGYLVLMSAATAALALAMTVGLFRDQQR